ncbi:MAG: glycosyltransferase family 2 protein [Salinivirgaceae bacterium]|jgi:GT2 family glycosyltransferase|nr:glycosyltransferase family 2 protein [Salinivirgaceae bacterium]
MTDQKYDNTALQTAIVILNWNGQKMLADFLPSVLKYTDTSIANVIVADNASSDNSVEWLKIHYPEVRIIELDQNYGFAGGYNKALEQVHATYYVLLNSDIEVTANWLPPLVSVLENDEQVAAVQPKLLAYHNKTSFEYAGASGGYIDKFGYPFCRGRILNTLEEDRGQYNNPVSVMWATGACLVIRAKQFHAAGGFDARFFAHMEEIDLCWRLKNQNFQIKVVPQSTVYHLGGGTLPNNSPRKLFLNYRNNLLLLYKNVPDNERAGIFFSRFILDILSAFLYLIKGQPELFVQVFKARFAYRKMRKHYHKSTSGEQKSLIAHKEIFPKSILWSYFVKKHKTFDSLSFKK